MTDLIGAMQNIDALAFLVLGIAVAVSWLRNRDASAAYLALAIVLISIVSALGRLPALFHLNAPVLSELDLLVLAASGYALLRYRAALIPLPRAWHAAAVAALATTGGVYLLATIAGARESLQLWGALGLIAAWAAVVIESIVRFWLVAGERPAVQAWRLRSLSLGFACIVAVLIVALAFAGFRTTAVPAEVELVIEFAVLAVVPLLYVSFAPPAWLRRDWRAGEEEGIRAYLEGLLVEGDAQAQYDGALAWAARITGAAGAASFDRRGRLRGAVGVDALDLGELHRLLPALGDHIEHHELRHGSTGVTAVPIAGPDGREPLFLVAGPFSPAFGRDELSRVQQFMTAVTAGLDRKRLVGELRSANAQLRQASEHKSVFLANMSHELRTPLNAIIGFSELMLDAGESQFDETTRKRFLTQVNTSGKHLLELINDILDLSKVEAGQMELRLQTLDLEPVVEDVLAIIEPLAVQKRITVIARARAAGTVDADAAKLRQMLLNLVSNAIKFTPERGRVTVSVGRTPAGVDIGVADNGIGISPEDQAKIFSEFHQVDPGPGRREQGTGLGLALTRRFALLHGGDVRVESERGRGSVFTLRLPVRPRAAAGGARSPAIERRAYGARYRPLVLVVEDDAGAAELLTRQLDAGGFRTHVTSSGAGALAMAHELRPAAITLDILLPDIDGWEVMARLKAAPATSDIPVVVVSVIDNPDLGMALGALDYFVKPVDPKLLVERLTRFAPTTGADDTAPSVLVVDDEDANRQWLSEVLEPAGFDVSLASGGQEAIEQARANPPDFVLLDLMMPEVTGFDVVEALRADRRTEDTPILILTARHLTDEDKRQLNGHVSTILSRGSVGASGLLGLLQRVVGDPVQPVAR